MSYNKLHALQGFFARFGTHPSLQESAATWRQLSGGGIGAEQTASLIELIDAASLFLEQEMQRRAYPRQLLDLHQALFLEMESLIAVAGVDERHSFIVVIPVADRPQQLQGCLQSLLQLCRRFTYGGLAGERYRKIRVLIADDSKETGNRQAIEAIQQRFTGLGLETLYFGRDEQLRQLDRLTSGQRQELGSVLGSHKADAFHHKGASITRNISYLKLRELVDQKARTLAWFVDSDQAFRVDTGSDDDGHYAINYFHRLDRIFDTTDTLVLTGKVVGDPPVSPAVMAANFLRDVTGFVTELAARQADGCCRFHPRQSIGAEGAAYHDMADLFGFNGKSDAFRYRCRLREGHDNLACFKDFSSLLNRFFDGEHPTRRNFYTNPPASTELTAARTLYTGNYVLRPQALSYFIPFATLKLRMAGPQLGRIMRAELGDRFVSANLPLLHKRTHDETGEAEFRAGIDKQRTDIDISGEFERQFFGDIMLFTLGSLIEEGYPHRPISDRRIEQILGETESAMRHRYGDNRNEIEAKLEALRRQFEERDHWWWRIDEAADAIANFRRFMRNMAYNFGEQSSGYRLIDSDRHREMRRKQIVQAILAYKQDRENWRKALSQPS
jgi:hypothetical protein